MVWISDYGFEFNASRTVRWGTDDAGDLWRKIAGRSTIATFIVLAIASFSNPLALYWALVILILQRNLERPSLNELTEPNDTRAAWGLLVFLFMILTLFPLTPALAAGLGIGS